MTTKVVIACPDQSPWSVDVSVEDKVFDFATQKHTDAWKQADSFTLKPTEAREVHVYDTRRLVIVEQARAAS
jgi:hypothetical protein